MNKKIVIASVVAALALVGFFVLKPENFEKKVTKLIESTTSYQMTGNMSINTSEDLKSYAITSSWMKTEDQEFFKVEMTDKNLNQQQIILKNAEGVYVITPSLNQVFKFQGEWPTNSPKPYLLQTILDLIELESSTMTKNDEGYLIEAPASYPSSHSLTTQRIQLSKELKPMYLMAFNDQMVCELEMVFHDVQFNVPFASDFFEAPVKTMTSSSTNYLEEADLPLYPMAVFDAKLVNVTVSNLSGNDEHILEFAGEKTFTITEKQISVPTELTLVEIEGQLVEGLGTLAYYNGNRLTSISTLMETSVYSDDLTVMEMLQVIDSMQVSLMK